MADLSCDIVIIGAGVAGLGCGWRLAEAGLDVLVVERDEPGAGASTAAAGMLAPVAEAEFGEEALCRLGLESLALYPEFVDALEAATGQSVDYRTEGTLVVGLDRDDVEALDHLGELHAGLGLDARRLSAEAARELEPGLSPSTHGALFVPGDHQVDPPRLVAALAAAVRAAGGTIMAGVAVDAVDVVAESRVRGVRLADGRTVDAPRVLVAAGAWSRQLGGLPEGMRPPIRPVRGQMLAVDLGDPPLCRHVIRAPDAYLSPKADGRLIIGATSEERGFDPRLTAGGLFELLRGAWEALPGVYDQAVLATWTGFRPVSLDNLPLLGPTAIEGLWLACGHGRNGILLTPITAVALSQAIVEGALPEALAPFAPARLGL